MNEDDQRLREFLLETRNIKAERERQNDEIDKWIEVRNFVLLLCFVIAVWFVS